MIVGIERVGIASTYQTGRLDLAGCGFEGPVARQPTGVIRRRHISPGHGRQEIDKADPHLPLRHIASVEQDIPGRRERCANGLKLAFVDREIAGIQHR